MLPSHNGEHKRQRNSSAFQLGHQWVCMCHSQLQCLALVPMLMLRCYLPISSLVASLVTLPTPPSRPPRLSAPRSTGSLEEIHQSIQINRHSDACWPPSWALRAAAQAHCPSDRREAASRGPAHTPSPCSADRASACGVLAAATRGRHSAIVGDWVCRLGPHLGSILPHPGPARPRPCLAFPFCSE